MTKTKRILSVLLSVLMLALSVIVASAETITYTSASISYAYDAENGILTISKDKGNHSIVISEFVISELILSLNDLGISSIKKVVLDESLDDVKVKKTDQNGAVLGEITVQAGDFIFFPFYLNGLKQGKRETLFQSFSYPAEIENRSSKALAVTFSSYYDTANGQKIFINGLYGEEADDIIFPILPENMSDEELRAWEAEKKEWEKAKINDFNSDWGTNFTTWEACKTFKQANEREFVAPIRLRCKKNSAQEYMYKEAGGLHYYTLLDASTTKTHSATGVKATYNNEAFSTPVSINVNKINAEKANMVAYEISPLDNAGNKVQPEEAVELCLPIPQTWNENDVQVLHTKDDNTTEEVNFVAIENQAVFYVSSFSKFTLVNTAGISANASEDPTTDHPASDPSVEKPSDEKSAPKLNFFQRILQWFRNLFAKLFGR